MHIAVCLKYVPDPATVEVDPLSGVIETSRLLYIINPADAAALELALHLCGENGGVHALTVGPPHADAALREALAAGATSSMRLWDERRDDTHPVLTARLLAAALQQQHMPDLVLCGTRSADRGSGQVPALLGEYLGWPVVTDVTSISFDQGVAQIQRRRDRGVREAGTVPLPAILAVEADTARLRHATLPGLMAAQRTSIPVCQPADLGLTPADVQFAMPMLSATLPPRPRPRVIFTPDSSLPAHERIGQILSAGMDRKAGQMLEGSPEHMARAILDFLRERGLLDTITAHTATEHEQALAVHQYLS